MSNSCRVRVSDKKSLHLLKALQHAGKNFVKKIIKQDLLIGKLGYRNFNQIWHTFYIIQVYRVNQ